MGRCGCFGSYIVVGIVVRWKVHMVWFGWLGVGEVREGGR